MLKISVIGGVGEIGMNMYLFETEHSAVLVDTGVMFGGHAYPGIDFIIPDLSYLEEISEKLSCIILSHGHEDHIGAIEIVYNLISQYRDEIKIYSTELAKALIESKRIKIDIDVVSSLEDIEVDDFVFQFIPVGHSISDTNGVLIKADGKKIFHISDYKLDFLENGDPVMPAAIAALGSVDILLSDSTNATSKGYSKPESHIDQDLTSLISNAEGRVFAATFSSNIERVKKLVTIAENSNRKAILVGSSMERTMKVAKELGYIDYPFISIAESCNLPKDQVCYIVTGCQGEEGAALYTIVHGQRRNLKFEEGDLFIQSSRIIPGNERNVSDIINKVYELGGTFVDAKEKNIHVSGHAYAEEIRYLIKTVRPKYFLPIHGIYKGLQAAIDLAEQEGVDRENCYIVPSGSNIVFESGEITLNKQEYKKVYVDRRGNIMMDLLQVKERMKLGSEGSVLICLSVNPGNKRRYKAGVDTLGFCMNDADKNDLLAIIGSTLIGELGLPEGLDNTASIRDWLLESRSALLSSVKKYFRKRMGRRPIVKVMIL